MGIPAEVVRFFPPLNPLDAPPNPARLGRSIRLLLQCCNLHFSHPFPPGLSTHRLRPG